MPTTLLVVPCYNEAERLPVSSFARFGAEHDDVAFLFVDDGSTDATASIIDGLVRDNPRSFRSLSLDRNLGKGEAVRLGILEAAGQAPQYLGYWDADLSTPLEEVVRLSDCHRRMPGKLMVAGARVKMMGRTIERRAVRHYLGRIFATAASGLLHIDMYDTQCGAKLLRCTPETVSLFEDPFQSRWLFDLELILRMRQQAGLRGDGSLGSLIHEVPLDAWRDVSGSKVSASYFLWAFFDLLALRLKYGKAFPARATTGPSDGRRPRE